MRVLIARREPLPLQRGNIQRLKYSAGNLCRIHLLGLGHLGKNTPDKAKTEFEAAIQLQDSHLGARTMLAELGNRNR